MGREAVHGFRVISSTAGEVSIILVHLLQLVLWSLTHSFTGCLTWVSGRGVVEHCWRPESYPEAGLNGVMISQKLGKQI